MSATVHVETDIGPLWLPADDRVITPWIAAHKRWEPAESAFCRSVLHRGWWCSTSARIVVTSRCCSPSS